jgi:hypothetical protein
LIGACSSNPSSENKTSKSAIDTTAGSQSNTLHKDQQTVNKSESFLGINTNEYIGVVLVNDQSHSDAPEFGFTDYNEDLTKWKDVQFSSSLNKLDYIGPFLFNYDNYILIFRCLEHKNGFNKVVINEATHTIKLISTKETNLIFHNWEQHLLKDVFSIDFNEKKNPVREEAKESSVQLSFSQEAIFHPAKIEGDWLKVKDDDGKEGWIKWRDEKGILLINLFYDA